MAVVEAVASGLIDVMFSDHNPQDVETKRLPFGEADFGAVGLETLLSAGLRLVHAGQIPLANLLRAMTTRPADILRLEQGAPEARRARRPHPLSTPTSPMVLEQGRPEIALQEHSPFDEARLQGVVKATMVGGHIVHGVVETMERA